MNEADSALQRDSNALRNFEAEIGAFVKARAAYIAAENGGLPQATRQSLLNALVLSAEAVVGKAESLGLYLCGDTDPACVDADVPHAIMPFPLLIYDLMPKYPGYSREHAPGLLQHIGHRNTMLI